MTVFVANDMCMCLPAFASLTCAGHGAWVGLGAVESLLADALDGLLLRGRAVWGTFGAVGVCGRGFVGAGSARWTEETDKHKVRGRAKSTTHDVDLTQ